MTSSELPAAADSPAGCVQRNENVRGGSRVDDGERHHCPAGVAVAEDDLAGRPGHRLVAGVVGPPLLEVLRTADHLEDDLGRRLDVDLALDGSELHDILLQRLVAHHEVTQDGNATFGCGTASRR